MATITQKLGGDANIVIEIDYDDVSMLLLTLRCINSSPDSVWGQATDLSKNRSYERTFPPFATTEQAIPTNPSGKMDITVTPSGKLDGIEYHFTL